MYGTALLATCLLAGVVVGEALGWLVGVDANVGGVGIAMLLLIVGGERLRAQGRLHPLTEQGVVFWSAIYIPIVVAMAASQNVLKALSGGVAAVCAGVLVVAVSFALVPLVARLGSDGSEQAS